MLIDTRKFTNGHRVEADIRLIGAGARA